MLTLLLASRAEAIVGVLTHRAESGSPIQPRRPQNDFMSYRGPGIQLIVHVAVIPTKSAECNPHKDQSLLENMGHGRR
jgi:hypothetical protein